MEGPVVGVVVFYIGGFVIYTVVLYGTVRTFVSFSNTSTFVATDFCVRCWPMGAPSASPAADEFLIFMFFQFYALFGIFPLPPVRHSSPWRRPTERWTRLAHEP